MGIESEQLVYDYLSRVGDLAQSAALTAADRARLVNTLRQTIDAQQAAAAPSSARAEVSSVRKILSGLGAPDEVVRRASGGGLTGPSAPSVPSVPVSPTSRPSPTAGPSVPAQAAPPPAERVAPAAPAAPGSAAFDDAYGDAEGQSVYAADEWWRGAGAARGTGRPIDSPPGWAGGLLAEFYREDRSGVMDPVTGLPRPQPPAAEVAPEPAPVPEAVPDQRGRLRRLVFGPQRPGAAPAPAPAPAEQGVAVPRARLPFVETLAAVVLVVAAVLGLWYLALLGWLFAYAGRRLGHRTGRVAALWIPGICAFACGFWLYSRTGHAPGHPAQTSAQVAAASRTAFATWLRAGSGLSAAFLAWRISRR